MLSQKTKRSVLEAEYDRTCQAGRLRIWPVLDRTEQDKDRTGQGRAGQGRTGQDEAAFLGLVPLIFL